MTLLHLHYTCLAHLIWIQRLQLSASPTHQPEKGPKTPCSYVLLDPAHITTIIFSTKTIVPHPSAKSTTHAQSHSAAADIQASITIKKKKIALHTNYICQTIQNQVTQELAGDSAITVTCWGSNIKIDVFVQRVKSKNPAGILTQDSLNTSQTLLLATRQHWRNQISGSWHQSARGCWWVCIFLGTWWDGCREGKEWPRDFTFMLKNWEDTSTVRM